MSDFDPITAAALASDDEPHAGDPTPRSGRSDCANCGEPLTGTYCATCGQRDQPLRMPVHRFLVQSATEFFGIDGRVWVTLRELLFRPGALTVAYVQGRRRRYLRPLRVYLSCTVLFFVLLTLLDPVGRFRDTFVDVASVDADSLVVVADQLADVEGRIAAEPERVARAERVADSLQTRADSLRQAVEALMSRAADASSDSLGEAIRDREETQRELLQAAVDAAEDGTDDLDDLRDDLADRRAELELEAAILGALPPDSTVRLADVHAARTRIYPESSTTIGLPGWMVRSGALRRLEAARSGDEAAEAGAAFARDSIGQIPTVLFLILPVFALLLKGLYARRGWYYAEHLVFGLHTHAFAFLAFTLIVLLLTVAPGATWARVTANVLFLLVIPLYFLLAQKRVYRQGWVKTILKSLVLGWVYLFVLIFGLVGVLFLAAALGG